MTLTSSDYKGFAKATGIGAVALFLLWLLVGCVSPGAETRRGLTQSKLYEWREDGSFWSEAVGTQTETFTMAEGAIVLNDDGTINFTESRLTHYLKAEPRADAAASTMAAMAGVLLEQSRITGEAIKTITDLAARVLPSATEPLPPPEVVIP